MANIELFLDQHHISWEHNISRQLNQPVKYESNPTLTGDYPWESSFVAAYGNVLPRDGGGFRIWYHSGSGGHTADKVLCYAESDDGIHWQRKMISNEPYEGVSPTNILLGPKPTIAVPCVIENQHSDAEKLTRVGEYRTNHKLEVKEHAAYTAFCSMILNLDETITKQ